MSDISVRIAAPLTPFSDACNETSNLIDAAKAAVGNLKSDGNFPKARAEAVQAIEDVVHALDDRLGGDLKAIYSHFYGEAKRIFVLLPESTKTPISMDGMTKLSAWLPTNSLHQYSYLNVHDFSKACDALSQEDDVAAKVDPQTFLYTSRDDMSARAIIVRTYLYVKGLIDSGNEDYFFLSFCYAAAKSDRFRTVLANKVREARDAIGSDELEKIKIEGLTNAEVKDKINAMLDMINSCLDEAKDAVADLKNCVSFYQSLAVCFGATEEALTEALRLYDEAQSITF